MPVLPYDGNQQAYTTSYAAVKHTRAKIIRLDDQAPPMLDNVPLVTWRRGNGGGRTL